MVLFDLALRSALALRPLPLPVAFLSCSVGVVVLGIIGPPLTVHTTLIAPQSLRLAVEAAAEVGGDHFAFGNKGNMGWPEVHPDHARAYGCFTSPCSSTLIQGAPLITSCA